MHSTPEKRIALYVQSTKTVAGTQQLDRIWARGDMHGTHRIKQVKYEYALPAEQEMIVNKVKSLRGEYGFALEILDVTRENVFPRVMHDSIKGIDVYPALLSDSGRWIEGITSKEQVDSFLSKEKEKWL